MTNMPGTDIDLRKAIEDVNLPNLLVSICCVTGQDDLLIEKFRPSAIIAAEGSLFPDDSGMYEPAIQEEIKELAVKILGELRDGKRTLAPAPDTARFKTLMSFAVAEPIEDSYATMMMEETCLKDRDDQWRPQLKAAVSKGKSDRFKIIIIGAGMSGMATAYKLKQAGIDFTILEKNSEVGGTWFENTYPDCGVDTPNHFYSYSFNRNANWSGYFSKRDELFTYFKTCADEFNIREHIQFNTEVSAATYDEISKSWQVDFQTQGQAPQSVKANAIVSAVGQLNRPSLPDIEGLDSFAGPLWHSARWEAEHDLHDKRVGIIGTGCSCVQLLPKTAAIAAQATVFQRSPHWVAPARDYYKPVEQGQLWALNHIPYYAEFHRARMIFIFGDRSWPAVVADPAWGDAENSLNEANQDMRNALVDFIKQGLGNKQHYVEKCVPDFPVWGKRLIVDNGWYETLARDNVNLVTDAITRVTAEGVVTADGTLHKLDALILATGFNANQLLFPMEIRGKSGKSLAETWGNSANAFKGISVPDFPNMFCLYGPNTNIVHGGSIILQVECQIHYMMQCITAMVDQSIDSLDVRTEANDEYNNEVQAISKTLAWGQSNVESWYKNSDGRVINNSPFSLQGFWEVTHDVDLADYIVERIGDSPAVLDSRK